MPDDGPVLYAEAGSSWWPLTWGPVFALVGVLVGGAMPVWVWLLAGAVLTLFTAVWVAARRRFREVRLTPTQLRGGREELPVERIASVEDVGAPLGAPVIGGGWLVPRGTTEVPLRLDDGSTVLAWARHPDALVAALRRLVGPPGA
jgi:hypothetical protein